MGLEIIRDAILYNNGTAWVPWDVIKGAKGDSGQDAYHAWLEVNHKTEQEVSKEEWTKMMMNFGAPGASRVVQDGSNIVVYTPLPTSAIVEPPTTDTEFKDWDLGEDQGWEKFTFSTQGATYRNLHPATSSTVDPHSHAFLMAQTVQTQTGDAVTIVDTVPAVGYDPRGIMCFGNRTAMPNLSTTSVGRLGEIIAPQLTMGYYQTDRITSTNKPNGTTSSYKDIYGTQRDVTALHLGAYEGNMYVGGHPGNTDEDAIQAADEHCNLGQTILVAGAASFTGRTIGMGSTVDAVTGYATTAKDGLEIRNDNSKNSIMTQRKYGTDKKWGGNWNFFSVVDSGHIVGYKWKAKDFFNKLVNTTSTNPLVTLNVNIPLKSGRGNAWFNTAPVIQYSIYNWGTSNNPQKSFDDLFVLRGVYYDISTQKLKADLFTKVTNLKEYFQTTKIRNNDLFEIHFTLLTDDYK